MITRSWFTPIKVAVSGSWATDRMPRPKRVRLTNWSSNVINTIAEAKMTSCWSVIFTPKIENTGLGTNIITAGSALGPRQMKNRYWMVNETPIAVIRKASGGAPFRRSGR